MLRRIIKSILIGSCAFVVLAFGYLSPMLLSWQTVTITNEGTEPLKVKVYNHVWTVGPANTGTFHFRSNQGEARFQIENGDNIEENGYVTTSLSSCHEITATDGEPIDFQYISGNFCHLRW